jgi:hypothetical protein
VNERESLAARFEASRTHLRAVADRMLGSPGSHAELRDSARASRRRCAGATCAGEDAP